MGIIFVLLPLALLFVGIAVAWFVWAVRSGQFDDLETPAVRILFDDPSGSSPDGSSRDGQEARPGSRTDPDPVNRSGRSPALLDGVQGGRRRPKAGGNNASTEREVEVR